MTGKHSNSRLFTHVVGTHDTREGALDLCAKQQPLARDRASLSRLASIGCLLEIRIDGKTAGVIGVDPKRSILAGPWIDKKHKQEPLFQKLVTAAEKRAVQFGLTKLRASPSPEGMSLFTHAGYQPSGAGNIMVRSIIRRSTRFSITVRKINNELGIPADYGASHSLQLQPESKALRSIGRDIYDRVQRMHPDAGKAWKRMVRQAQKDGVELQPVSAFRSVEYQAGLVRRKLDKGLGMDEILEVSAAPGFSEHHTGRAIDVTTPGSAVLEEEFENSEAYKWLCDHASEFGFRLSFPRDNIHNIAYEPWHWCWNT